MPYKKSARRRYNVPDVVKHPREPPLKKAARLRKAANNSKTALKGVDLWAEFVKVPDRVPGTTQDDFDAAIDEMLNCTINPGPGSSIPMFDSVDLDHGAAISLSRLVNRRSGKKAKRNRRNRGARHSTFDPSAREGGSDVSGESGESGDDDASNGGSNGSGGSAVSGDDDASGDSDDSRGSDAEWVIESIVGEHTTVSGKEYLVKWAGSDEETWESASNLADTMALDQYLRV
jgi:hypothetical protein